MNAMESAKASNPMISDADGKVSGTDVKNSVSDGTESMQRIIESIAKKVKRPGVDKLMKWLAHTDFYTAPASTHFHGSYHGGLAQHCFNVVNRMEQEMLELPTYRNLTGDALEAMRESVIVCGLFHDLAKVNFYEVSSKNVKDAGGNWISVPFYSVRSDKLGYGHGEEAVYILMSFGIPLSREEAFAIRFHMGDFTDRNTSAAYNNYPMALALHLADMKATYIDERIAAK